MNELIANEKDINDEIQHNYFKYQSPSFLAKDLIRGKQAKNQQLVNNVNDGLTDLGNAIIRKEIRESENPNKFQGNCQRKSPFSITLKANFCNNVLLQTFSLVEF